MSKILKDQKTNCKRWNFGNVLYCEYLHFFLNKNSRIFLNSLIKSIIRIMKHHKNV